MSTENLRFLITAVLAIHGLGHVGAIGALVTRQLGYLDAADGAGWHAARSWLLPSLSDHAGTAVASGFWLISMVGFLAAACAFWGVLVPGESWRPIAVAAAIVSTVGILLFAGTWPAFNTVAALSVDVAVLVSQLWMGWPARLVFGK